MTSAFISYSRRNAPFAHRLYLDLKRAGVDAWLDVPDLPSHRKFGPAIENAIEERDDFLLLASPEAANLKSFVHQELAHAEKRQKPIHTLRVGGSIDQLPADWRDRNIIGNAEEVSRKVALVLRHLQAPSLPLLSLADLLDREQGTVAEAADLLSGAESWTIFGREYRALPVEPSGYTMTWLVGPANASAVAAAPASGAAQVHGSRRARRNGSRRHPIPVRNRHHGPMDSVRSWAAQRRGHIRASPGLPACVG